MTDHEILLQATENVNYEDTEVLIDCELLKQLKLVSEMYADLISRLDKLADYKALERRVSTLETVVKSHTDDIQALQKAAGT